MYAGSYAASLAHSCKKRARFCLGGSRNSWLAELSPSLSGASPPPPFRERAARSFADKIETAHAPQITRRPIHAAPHAVHILSPNPSSRRQQRRLHRTARSGLSRDDGATPTCPWAMGLPRLRQAVLQAHVRYAERRTGGRRAARESRRHGFGSSRALLCR